MKRVLFILSLLLFIACSKDDEQKQCDCDKVEYSGVITLDRAEHFGEPAPDPDEFELKESERDFYGVDCSENGDTLSQKTYTSELPQKYIYSYVVKKVECK